MTMIGLPIDWQSVRQLRCGCIKTVTRNGAFEVTEITVQSGCHKHDETAPSPRSGMSKRLRFSILERDDFTCQYCGLRPPYTVLQVDHIIAVTHGGDSSPDNLITACADCNSGKSDR